MKKLLTAAAFLLVLLVGCSAASFNEHYSQTPVQAHSLGQGEKAYRIEYNGQTYTARKGVDGRYYVVTK